MSNSMPVYIHTVNGERYAGDIRVSNAGRVFCVPTPQATKDEQRVLMAISGLFIAMNARVYSVTVDMSRGIAEIRLPQDEMIVMHLPGFLGKSEKVGGGDTLQA